MIRLRLRTIAPALLAASLAISGGPLALAASPSVTITQSATPLAQGVTHTSFERLYPHGWVQGHIIRADLGAPGIAADLLSAQSVTAAEPLSAMAARAGAIAGINGDFFDITNTKMPLGPALQNGQLLKSGPAGWQAVGLDANGFGHLLSVALSGSVTLPGGQVPLASLNQYTVPEDSIGLYTPLWTAGRSKGAAFGADRVREVTIQNGLVTRISEMTTDEPTAPDMLHLVGREMGADLLSSLQVGDPITVTYGAEPYLGAALRFAVGGQAVLVRDGQVQADLNSVKLAARSAMGFTADGQGLILLTVDGSSRQSSGLTLQQLADLMQELGAYNALELDGGGSTTTVVRNPADQQPTVVNRPSDGVERRVPNGVGIFAPPGSGRAVGSTISPQTKAPGADRVFPGLSRLLTAQAHDEQFTPVASDAPRWSILTPNIGTLSATGWFRAKSTGSARVRGNIEGNRAEFRLRVLGSLTRIEADRPGLQLGASRTGRFYVRGYDADGLSAPIEPRDVTLTYDKTKLTVSPTADGGFQVTLPADGQAVIELEVQGQKSLLPVSSGLHTQLVADFEQAQPFQFSRYPATVEGGLAVAPGRTGQGLKLTYDLLGTGTRAAYLEAPDGLALPGAPEALSMWVKGDAKGAWLRATVVDAANRTYTLDLHEGIDWLDWAKVEAPIPSGAAAPLKLTRIYPVETDAAQAYAGELIFDDLSVAQPLELPAVPEPPARPDPAIVPLADLADGGQRIAFLPGFAESASAPDGVPVVSPGQPEPTQDLGSTRLLFLDTSGGGLRATDFDQVGRLQADLQAAAKDPTVSHVVVVANHALGRLPDWREAALIERWLTDFKLQAPNKTVTYVAPGSETAIVRVEGAAYVYGQALLLNLTADGGMQVSTLPADLTD